ncbi:MAG: hypothetical protein JOY64_00570 [Alphaproteobacteria bacterium]|nr:hypothetical protein [Alphaproteobacteria bacterium]MBV8406097.1 hypothetical protein [Alphaproteobacteria bacterium]
MPETRRYSIEVKDAKANTLVVSAAVDWTSDEKQIALTQIFRLPGLGDNASREPSRQRRPRGRGARKLSDNRPL